MDDPRNIPEAQPSDPSKDLESAPKGAPESASDLPFTLGPIVETVAPAELTRPQTRASIPNGDGESRRLNFRHNIFLLLSLTLAAFTLAAWVLVRVDTPFGLFFSGPQEVVRAQLRALDRGDLRPAYEMFSPRYRGEVSFDAWHQLIVTHWRMFHAEILHSETSSQTGPGVTLEMYLHGADDKDYRARFILIHAAGRWWIDDVHWEQEPDQHDISRT